MVMDKIAVILAGGKSQRFGGDKVFVPFRGKPIINVLIEILSSAHFEVVLSGSKEGLSSLSLPVIEDQDPFLGPLVALQGILSHLDDSKILLTACDMPFLKKEIITLLWDRGRDQDVAILTDRDRPCPLPGVYSRKILPTLRQLIKSGRRDLKSLLDSKATVSLLPEGDWRTLDSEGQSLWNINTVEDLHRIENRLQRL
ncbi:MAG: hypothetical protein A3I75_03760 [Deltaproteobacteria bacterium RIFCSPLOWO2_02_FULL_50_16]|nr:MAG: hypothetical protein A2053_03445 [Deltaproteobacteria bacterium GWA2_50_8]OGQ58537.1 MAG: hypothetical protein A3I75_03760 [Deltaproteobacteria bacterium RIFCSPLOWO2_02_FULL_50_16]